MIHMIPEMLGVEKTLDLIKQIKDRVISRPNAPMTSPTILFLGYKETGRGKDVPNVRFSQLPRPDKSGRGLSNRL